MSSQSPRHEELEAQLAAEPADRQLWAVYGDWLSERGDSRGAAIALQLEGRDDELEALRAEELDRWIGPELAALWERVTADPEDEDDEYQYEPMLQVEWFGGFITEARVTHVPDVDVDFAEYVAALLASPATLLLQKLTFTSQYVDGELAEALVVLATQPRPALRSLMVWGLTWVNNNDSSDVHTPIGDITPVLDCAARLEKLDLTGEIVVSRMKHDRLREAELHSACLNAATARALAAADCPALEALEIWFGDEESGCDVTPQDLAELWTNQTLPALRKLALGNAEFTDQLIQLLAGSGLLPQLQVLDLGFGTLTDAGAATLLVHAGAFGHLDELELAESWLSEPTVARLQQTFGADTVKAADQGDPEQGPRVAFGAIW